MQSDWYDADRDDFPTQRLLYNGPFAGYGMQLLILSLIISFFLTRTDLYPHFSFGPINIHLTDLIILFSNIYIFHNLFKHFKTVFNSIFTTILLSFIITAYQYVFKIDVPLNIIFPTGFLVYHYYRICKVNRNDGISLVVILPFTYTLLQLIRSISIFGLQAAANGSRTGLMTWTAVMTLYLLSRKMEEEQKRAYLHYALTGYLVSAIVVFMLAAFNLVSRVEGAHGVNRYITSEEALIFSICSVYVLGKIFQAPAGRFRYYLLFILSSYGAVFTYHRSVWIATFCGYFTVSLLNKKKGLQTVVGILVIAAFLLPFMPGHLLKGLSLSLDNALDYKEGNTVSWRVEGWKQLMSTVIVNSPIAGMGFGASRSRYINHGGVFIEWNVSAHNHYVETFYTGGIIGTIIDLLCLICIARKSLKIKGHNNLSTILFSIVITYSAYHFSYSLGSTFGVIFGLILSCVYKSETHRFPVAFKFQKQKYEQTGTAI